MRFLLSMVVVLGVLCVQSVASAADGERIVRFYGGEVVRAELKPGDGGIEILNVDKYAPPSRVTTDLGVAVVSVRMDKGRTLSSYDYSLVNGRKDVFPCVAIMNSVGEYDDSFRKLTKTKPNQFFNLLFRVEMPGHKKKPRYIFRFNLRRGKKRDPILTFVDLGKFPFTKTSKIPLDGMLGVIPDCMKPKPKPKPKPVVKPVVVPPKAGGEAVKSDPKKKVDPKAAKPAAKKAPAKKTPAPKAPKK